MIAGRGAISLDLMVENAEAFHWQAEARARKASMNALTRKTSKSAEAEAAPKKSQPDKGSVSKMVRVVYPPPAPAGGGSGAGVVVPPQQPEPTATISEPGSQPRNPGPELEMQDVGGADGGEEAEAVEIRKKKR